MNFPWLFRISSLILDGISNLVAGLRSLSVLIFLKLVLSRELSTFLAALAGSISINISEEDDEERARFSVVD